VLEYSVEEDVSGMSVSSGKLAVEFPSFFEWNNYFDEVLSWHGAFIRPNRAVSEGFEAGPHLFYTNPKRAGENREAILISSVNQFLSSAVSATFWNGSDDGIGFGLSGMVETLPKDFTHEFMIYHGSEGLTSTVYEWGDLLQKAYKLNRSADITVDKIGYQTDNGAMYCFCNHLCDETLLNETDYLHSIGIDYGYMSFQGAWWKNKGESAPWCIGTWEGNGKYPMGIAEFQHALDKPLQLYLPYLCNNSDYSTDKQWNWIYSDTTLSGCKNWGFLEIEPSQSKEWFEWVFNKSIVEYGMRSFEVDFLDANYKCIREFVSDTSSAKSWMKGMNDAGVSYDIPIQWCYSTPPELLQSLELPMVTNFRGSNDYYFGGSWDTGISFLLIHALGIRPSTDTFWTTNNSGLGPEAPYHACGSKGCPPDHSDAGGLLHSILALFSTGPVGFSDAIGQTNASRLFPMIRKDGQLLQPTRPLTSIESLLANDKSSMPKGQIYMSHTIGLPTAHGSLGVSAYYILGHQLNEPFDLKPFDIYPSPAPGSYALWQWNGKHNPVVSTMKIFNPTDVLWTVPSYGSSDSYTPYLYTLVPFCEDAGIAVLGETDKYVSMSEKRFMSAPLCGVSSVKIEVNGGPSETVTVRYVHLNGVVGSVSYDFGTKETVTLTIV